MRSKSDKQFLDAMSKDPGNWRGPFYYNRKDPRLMVPKFQSAMGWTLNFASPLSYIAIAALIAAIILIAIFFK
jgi:uncharacterized membrane protein